MIPHLESRHSDPGWSLEPPEWTLSAACRSVPDDAIWYPIRSGDVRPAKGICSGCPVRRECLDDAMTFEAGHYESTRGGVWGGLSPVERYKLHRSGWRPGDEPPPVVHFPDRCDKCGRRFADIDRHNAAKHPERAA